MYTKVNPKIRESSIIKKDEKNFSIIVDGKEFGRYEIWGDSEAEVLDSTSFTYDLKEAIESIQDPQRKGNLISENAENLFNGGEWFYTSSHLKEIGDNNRILSLAYGSPLDQLSFDMSNLKGDYFKSLMSGVFSALGKYYLKIYDGSYDNGKYESLNEEGMRKFHGGDHTARKMAEGIDILTLSEDEGNIRAGVENILLFEPMECNRNPHLGAFRGAAAINNWELMIKSAVLSSVAASWVDEIFKHVDYVLDHFEEKQKASIEIAEKLEAFSENYPISEFSNRRSSALRAALSYHLVAGGEKRFKKFLSEHEEEGVFNLHAVYQQTNMFLKAKDVSSADQVDASVVEIHDQLARKLIEEHAEYRHPNFKPTPLGYVSDSYVRLKNSEGLSIVLEYALKDISEEEVAIRKIGESGLVTLTPSLREMLFNHALPLIQRGLICKGFEFLDLFNFDGDERLTSAVKSYISRLNVPLKKDAGLTKAVEYLRQHGNDYDRALINYS